jgi:hypothetical protein
MTLVRIEIDVAGERQVSRAFEATAREAEDLSEPLHDVGGLILRQVGEQFLTEGAHGGSPWQRLSRAYDAWKEEHFPGRPLLVRTGAMRAAALSPQAISVGPRRLVYELDDTAGASYMREGEEHDVGAIAYIHQKGKGHQRVRKILQLNPVARREIDRTFVEWLNAVRRHTRIGA